MDASLNGSNGKPQTPGAIIGGLGMAAAQAPDGSWWVNITHQTGNCSYTFGIPLDYADQYADDYARNIHELAKEARRARTGLVIAPGPIRESMGTVVDPKRNGRG